MVLCLLLTALGVLVAVSVAFLLMLASWEQDLRIAAEGAVILVCHVVCRLALPGPCCKAPQGVEQDRGRALAASSTCSTRSRLAPKGTFARSTARRSRRLQTTRTIRCDSSQTGMGLRAPFASFAAKGRHPLIGMTPRPRRGMWDMVVASSPSGDADSAHEWGDVR